jgi:preprotein translocase subunit YajC
MMVPEILAQGAPTGGGNPLMDMLPMIVIFMGIFYFMIIRPQKRKDQEHKDMLSKASKGQKVIFGGGMIGMISGVKEKTFTIKLADNVKIEVLKSSVSKILDKGDPLSDEAA